MGKLLQVRVSAWTFDEDEVKKEWPSLWRLMWDDGGDSIPKKGVMELAKAVYDAVRAGLIPRDQADELKEEAERLDGVRHKIEEALGSWQPKEADKLIYELEDGLSALEDIARKF